MNPCNLELAPGDAKDGQYCSLENGWSYPASMHLIRHAGWFLFWCACLTVVFGQVQRTKLASQMPVCYLIGTILCSGLSRVNANDVFCCCWNGSIMLGKWKVNYMAADKTGYKKGSVKKTCMTTSISLLCLAYFIIMERLNHAPSSTDNCGPTLWCGWKSLPPFEFLELTILRAQDRTWEMKWEGEWL